jgi:exopolyphosphatase/pppGpp-phosphohydrolase
MTQFYILEIKQLSNGEFEHNVYYAWDENPNKARLKAESKYHEILSQAAISDTKKHSAIIVSEESFPVVNQCYKHENEVSE